MNFTEMNSKAPHCVVIGAGIIGSSCAWYLQQRGAQVTLVDPELPGQMTSSGNCGCISPSAVIPFSYPGVSWQVPRWLFDPLGPLFIHWSHLPALLPWLWRFWRSANRETLNHVVKSQHQLMQRVVADFDEVLYAINATTLRRSRGLIRIFDTEKDYQANQWQRDLKTSLGLEWRRLAAGELHELEPHLSLPGGVAMMIPDWQHLLDPGLVTARIAEATFANGARWIHDQVTSVDPLEQGVRIVTGSGRELEADKVVVAAGAWSGRLAGPLDGSVPLAPKRGYHSMIANPGIELNHPVQSAARFMVMTPMNDGLRIAGTAEFAHLDTPPDYRRARVLLDHARHYLPDVEAGEVGEWMGSRPMMPDSLPVIGRSPRHADVFYAFGHGHYGLTQGPTTGRMIASLVYGEDPGIDLEPYRFDRF
jgi:D-amino-acid dehydrogenase